METRFFWQRSNQETMISKGIEVGHGRHKGDRSMVGLAEVQMKGSLRVLGMLRRVNQRRGW